MHNVIVLQRANANLERGGFSLGFFCCTLSMFVVSVNIKINIVKLNVHYYENVCLFCCQN